MEKTKKKIIVIKKKQEPSKPQKTKDPSDKKPKASQAIAREVKYIYPPDCKDILSRKTFRGKVRSKVNTFEVQLGKLEKDSTKYKKLNREFQEYVKTVLVSYKK